MCPAKDTYKLFFVLNYSLQILSAFWNFSGLHYCLFVKVLLKIKTLCQSAPGALSEVFIGAASATNINISPRSFIVNLKMKFFFEFFKSDKKNSEYHLLYSADTCKFGVFVFFYMYSFFSDYNIAFSCFISTKKAPAD